MIFIVDGDMEREFIEKVCGQRFPIRIIPNSRNLNKERLWEFIATHLRELKNRYNQATIWIDHEGRQESPQDVKQYILDNTTTYIGDEFTVYIGIANKMKENWMLADPDAISQHYNTDFTYDPSYEGAGGKTIIKRIARKCNDNYIERIDGVEILRRSCILNISNNSESANDFLQDIHGIDCLWLWRNRN